MITVVLTLGFIATCVLLLKWRTADHWNPGGDASHLSLEAELYDQTVEASEHERIEFPVLEQVRWTALDDHQLNRVLRESAE